MATLTGCDGVFGLMHFDYNLDGGGDGPRGDGMHDASSDGMPGCSPAAFSLEEPLTAFNLDEISVAESSNIAISIQTETIGVVSPIATAPATPTSIGNAAIYISPALTPAADELFLADLGQPPLVTIVESTHMPGTSVAMWSAPIAILHDVGYPGTPAVIGGEVRMPVRTTSGFDEYARIGGVWSPVPNGHYNATDIGPSASATMLSPSFTPDGLVMVFAYDDGVAHGVMFARRGSIKTRFVKGAQIVDVQITSPVLTNDCQRLYGITVQKGLVRFHH